MAELDLRVGTEPVPAPWQAALASAGGPLVRYANTAARTQRFVPAANADLLAGATVIVPPLCRGLEDEFEIRRRLAEIDTYEVLE